MSAGPPDRLPPPDGDRFGADDRPNLDKGLDKGAGVGEGMGAGIGEGVDVGEFRQGTPLSRWALARYLVGRVLTESLGQALLTVGVVLLVLAALLIWWAKLPVLGVLLIVLAVGTLLMRALLLAIVRRVTGFRHYKPIEDRMRTLVDDTSKGVLDELGRIGLPSHMLTAPLIAVRLVRPSRRQQTLERLRAFDTERAVPKARLDEMHLLIQRAAGSEPTP